VLSNTFTSFLLAFSALFSIVNPFGGALIFSQVTENRSRPDRIKLAWTVGLYSAIVMIVALLAGAPVLNFFGISISALRMAGGFVVATSAWELLSGTGSVEHRKHEQAAPASELTDVAFFPLTMPFTTGPGTIAVAIALSANGPAAGQDLATFLIGDILAAVVVAVIVGASYASADRLVALLGRSGSRIVSRLAAFILLCIGVQIFLTGITEWIVPLLAARS
jgi:multiple antibiotic resistance protein